MFGQQERRRVETSAQAGIPAVTVGPIQASLLVICGLLLISMLLVWLLVDIWPLRRHQGPRSEDHRLARAARGFAALAGLLGALLVAAILLGYDTRLRPPGLELSAWNALPVPFLVVFYAATVLITSLTAGLLVFNFYAWRGRFWSLLERIYYLVFTLTWLALVLALYFGSRLGAVV